MTSSSLARIACAFGLGAVSAWVLWIALRETFRQPMFLRKNFRGKDVPVGAGVLLSFATMMVWGAWRLVASAFNWSDHAQGALEAAVLITAGFGLLGLFDDLAATGDDKGFRGHISALLKGRLTTGGIKLIGGGFLSLTLVALTNDVANWWELLLGGAVISLAANLGNLFDRAPARCTKVAVLCAAVLLATASGAAQWTLVSVALIIGAAIGLVVFEAREELMLGDAGSNVLGAALGWGLVATSGWAAQLIAFVVLLALNIMSEKVSFSKVIDSVGPLRAFDQLGRRP